MDLKATCYEVSDGVAVVTLARPKRRNAWTGRMHTEYRWILREADRDPAVRVIVVTGDPEGNAFCAGADLQALEGHSERGQYDAGTPEDIAEPGYGVDPAFDATFAYHFGIGKPVIAAINGAAAGVGLVLAAYADLRFCVPGAKFTAAHGRFNFPAEYGLSWLLPRIVGLSHANDILLSSRVFTAEEADRMGFLNRIVPAEELLPAAFAYADAIAANAPLAVRATRAGVRELLALPLDAAWQRQEELGRPLRKTDDAREAQQAFVEKRKPVWKGR